MSAIIDQLMKDPTAAKLYEEFGRRMAAEREALEQFIADLTPDVKAEFINGEAIYHSPARNDHMDASEAVSKLLYAYLEKNPGGRVRVEKALVRMTRNAYEPDVCYFGPTKASLLVPGTMEFPIPDLVVEILSESTEARDRGVKFQDYAAHGVREYWIVDARRFNVEQYILDGTSYATRLNSGRGTLNCEAVPGLKFPVVAIFNEQENIQAVRRLRGTE